MSELQAHTYKDGQCTFCGYTDPNHDCVGGRYYGNDVAHWEACRICGQKLGERQLHDYAHGSCQVCGSCAPDHVHSYVWFSFSSANLQNMQHIQWCEICGKINKDAELHTFVNNKCKTCGLLNPALTPTSIRVGNNRNREMTITLTFADGTSLALTVIGMQVGASGYHYEEGRIYTKEGVGLEVTLLWNENEQCAVRYGKVTSNYGAYTYWKDINEVAGLKGMVVETSSYANGIWTVNGKAYDGKSAVMILNEDMTVQSYTIIDLAAPTAKPSYVSSTGKPYIKWDAVAGAASYSVYRSGSKDGTYTLLGTTTSLNYTDGKAVAGTTYYYKIQAAAADGTRSDLSAAVTITCRCAKPVVKASYVSASGKPYISWEAVSGAGKYYVYRSTSKDGTYEYIGYTTKTNYTDSKAVAGTTYYYKVKAISSVKSTANSALSASVTITCRCAKPVVKPSYVSSSGKSYISWEAVSGAGMYYVYRSTSKDGTYEYIGYTTKTNYTDSKAVAGTTYYYKVKAISSVKSTANSVLSASVTITCRCAKPVVKPSYVSSSGKPYISWEAVSGAGMYYVYRSTSKDGTYEYIGYTTKTNYTDSKAVAGTTYYYKVKAISSVKSTANSVLSASVTITCRCAKPVVKITTTSAGKPMLTWDAVAGASKYEIYRATSQNGTYTKMYTTTALSYTNTSAKAGTTYYYKVKAVSKVKSTANSAYSAVVSIKAK